MELNESFKYKFAIFNAFYTTFYLQVFLENFFKRKKFTHTILRLIEKKFHFLYLIKLKQMKNLQDQIKTKQQQQLQTNTA